MSIRAWIRLICAAVVAFQFLVTVPPGPGPTPVPTPTPTPTPVPVPDPVIEGQRTVVIIRESGDDTPAFGSVIYGLRAGAHDDYLDQKGHTLLILDRNQLDENGQPSQLVAGLLGRNSNLPALFILESSDLRPLHDETLPATATADDVMRILKAHGG